MGRTSWFVFAGGGTGGHLFPALSVADALRAENGEIDVSFVCTERELDRDLLGRAGVEAIPLSVRPFPRQPWHWPGFLSRWQASKRLCRELFVRRRPAAVIGAGGYASGPPVRVAMRMGIPTYLLNPDAVPGRANQYLARRGQLAGIFAQWDVTRQHLPPAAPVHVTGCPVRPEFRREDRASRAEILQSFELCPDRRTLLVTGASQGARTINEAMMRLAGTIDFGGWQVLHLSGSADRDRVAAAYAQAGSASGTGRFHGRVLAFTDRMADAMRAADLVVSRAGASTLAELIAMGKPSILLPYPYHRDQHQMHNAMVLVQAGAAATVEDARDTAVNAGRLGPVLARLMHDHDQLSGMARSARSLDRPAAAAGIAHQLLRAARAGSPAGAEMAAERPAPAISRRTA